MRLKKLIPFFIAMSSGRSSFSQEGKINVYVFVAEECPVTISMTPSLKSVAERYANGKTAFWLVFPFATTTDKTAGLFIRESGLAQFGIRLDKDQSLTKKLGATVTPEAIITGTDGTVLYRGRINDSFSQPGKKKHGYAGNDLADALENISSGKEMPKPWKPAVGCFITLEN